ncbi:hypothetical protein PV517_32460 [Streptomyces griseiscabiei]|uniref:Uncharacterized protein n=1 Tax=Streptomyces griseiscabiei TaxID=2993540 RepID=A0ABU4LCK6_9ACTN|nr:hypothetical protein [Streptomyces griseiscabiei]MDX2913368.1 hypothetical protein [Streptomyces griseiscabiei]
MVEDVLGGEVEALAAGAADELDGVDAVRAEGEQVVVDAQFGAA